MCRQRWPEVVVLAAAGAVAVLGARPFAGGWNDGSRLAAVESLADRGTLAVDGSVFVRPPPAEPGRPHPYPADPPGLRLTGTLDKLHIGGRFYSDKSPVPTVLMAGLYAGWRVVGGPSVADRPDAVIRTLTVCTSGAAYVFAVGCVLRLGRRAGLTSLTLAVYGGGFAFATAALPYTRHVNNHVLLLGAAAGVCVLLAELDGRRWKYAAVGALAGLGYATDLGAGPPLAAAAGVSVACATRRAGPVVLVSLAAAPWVVSHHVLNYMVGGTVGPANAVPAYLAWPGSPFTADTMTGGLKHSPGGFVLYALDLMFGKKGFISTSVPLWLAVAGGVRLAWRDAAARPAVLFAAGWGGGVWLLYAAASNNYGGQSASVRWLVPLVAPGYWVLAKVVAAEPRYAADMRWLTSCGLPVAGLMWAAGPWMPRMVPGLWGWLAAAGVGWAVIAARRPGGEIPLSGRGGVGIGVSALASRAIPR